MEMTILRTFILACGILSTALGVLFLISPDSGQRLSQAVNRTILILDSAFGKRPRMSGGILILVGIFFLLFMY